MTMSKETIISTVIDALRDVCAGASASINCLTDIPGWDSLRLAEFVIALQKRFELRFNPEEIGCIVSIASAVNLIESRLSKS